MLTKSFDERVARVEIRPHVGDPEEIVEGLVRGGMELIVASGMHQDGWAAFDSKINIHHPEMDPDFLPGLIRLCHQNDIMVISWYNMNQNVPMGRERPHWQAKLMHPEEQTDTSFLCVMSSPYRDFVIDFSREILELGFDGLWYDGSRVDWHGGSPPCFCQYCQEAYRQDAGNELPREINWEDPNFRQWVRWRYRRFDDFTTDLYDRLQADVPDANILMNHYNRPGMRDIHSVDMTWKTGVPIDVVRFRGGGGNENVSCLNRTHTTGFNARIVKAMHPDRWDVWEPYGTIWRAVVIPGIEDHKLHHLLHGFWCLALGGMPWTAGQETFMKCGRYDTTVADEWKKRMPYHGGESLAYAGIHFSQNTRDFYGRDYPARYAAAVYGLYEVLVEGHYLTDLVLDGHLEPDYLKRFSLLVLSNSACLSASQCDAIREFVREGGVLVATYETSLYDEDGTKRDDFQLADLFGVHYVGTHLMEPGPWGDSPYDRDNIPKELCVSDVLEESLRETVARKLFFGADFVEVTCDPAEQMSVLIQTPVSGGSADDGRFCPGAVVRSCGSGRVAYIGADAGRGFLSWPLPEVRAFLQ